MGNVVSAASGYEPHEMRFWQSMDEPRKNERDKTCQDKRRDSHDDYQWNNKKNLESAWIKASKFERDSLHKTNDNKMARKTKAKCCARSKIAERKLTRNNKPKRNNTLIIINSICIFGLTSTCGIQLCLRLITLTAISYLHVFCTEFCKKCSTIFWSKE